MQASGGFDFEEEAFRAEDGGQVGAEHLDRDLALVLEIVGQVDGRHTTLAELALEAVAVGQRGGEAFRNGGQVDPGGGMTIV